VGKADLIGRGSKYVIGSLSCWIGLDWILQNGPMPNSESEFQLSIINSTFPLEQCFSTAQPVKLKVKPYDIINYKRQKLKSLAQRVRSTLYVCHTNKPAQIKGR